MALKKICNKTGCNTLVEAGQRYCDLHKNARHKQYDLYERNERSTQFYHSAEWSRVRAMAYRRDNGLCQDCLEQRMLVKGKIVHHIIEVKDDYSKRLDLDNLRTVCLPCHNRIHNQK